MAELTRQSISTSGVTPSYTSATADGDTVDNDGSTFLHVKNGSGGDLTVTIDSPAECDQGFTHDVAVVVSAGSEEMIGPFPPHRFNDSDGELSITYSGVTSLTIAALTIVS